jgi:heat shock protein HslJ
MTTFMTLLWMFACGDKANDTATTDDTATTTEESYSFQGIDFRFESADGFRLVGDSMSLSFPSDSLEMRFSAGCNTHYAEYQVNNTVFETSMMSATEMGCDTALMDQDTWLAEFFMSSPTVEHDGDMLRFTGSDATLVFIDEEVAVPDLMLTSLTWEIDTYIDGDAVSAYNLNVLPNVYFAPDGTFTANMGCNGAGGSYSDDGGTLTLTFEMMTEAMCEGDLNTVESHIFNVLNNTPTYEIDGERLTLMAGERGISAYASAE